MDSAIIAIEKVTFLMGNRAMQLELFLQAVGAEIMCAVPRCNGLIAIS